MVTTLAQPRRNDPIGALILWATGVVETGRAIITGRMRLAAPTQAEPLHIGFGTGTTATATTQTALVTERTVEARPAGTSSQQTTTTANDTYRVVGTFTMSQAGPVAITEAGLFDLTRGAAVAAPAGVMFLRSDFAAVNLSLNDSLTLTFLVQMTSTAA